MGAGNFTTKHTDGINKLNIAGEAQGIATKGLRSIGIHRAMNPYDGSKGYGATRPIARVRAMAEKKKLGRAKKEVLECVVYFGALLAGIAIVSLICNWIS